MSINIFFHVLKYMFMLKEKSRKIHVHGLNKNHVTQIISSHDFYPKLIRKSGKIMENLLYTNPDF